MAVIAFVGGDKTGKTTLRHRIHGVSNKHIIIDRFTACQSVFGTYYNKQDTPSDAAMHVLEEYLAVAPIPFCMVWIRACKEVVHKRCIQHNEQFNILDYHLIDHAYSNYIQNVKMPTLTIDTSTSQIEDDVRAIITFANDVDWSHKW